MNVLTWGFGKLGQLGNGKGETDTQHTPVRPKLPTNTEVCDIHCGGYYTAVISKNGHLYTFGCGKYGRLGTGDEEDRLEPVKIKAKDDDKGNITFRKVSCGIWHGAAIANDNNIYIWGYGKSHGVLGDPTLPSAALPTILNGPFNSIVSGIACGNNFTLLWTSDGEAYSWGCGRHGVLGHEDGSDKNTPTIISSFKNNSVKVIHMSAGFAHSGVVNSDGRLYMFGKGEDGALGLGPSPPKQVNEPRLVSTLQDVHITELSCNVGEKHGHTLCVSNQGQVFAFGDGYKGKLGLGDQNSHFAPAEIPKENFNGEHINHVSAGGIHSAAVSAEGHMFTWGCGSDGRLGHPEGKGHRYLFRSDVPREVEGLSKVGKAVSVSCFYYHTVALIETRKT
ncbi:probable E3 ubiquitin-protein ligase HERC3 [Mercenaria mercenaria]|uniref:probable E3 ubiquitin-protein ligase HERC3 n=1 Tax=Mercenaria mercenaria TaxID=6596 RepID=UPI00234F8956|nr:probable E3 ubiquitin-protein ligase HERC3 [Mercenaria mercenaria]